MRRSALLVVAAVLTSTFAVLLFSANVDVTGATPPQEHWEVLPAHPPGDSSERMVVHPAPGVTVIYNPTDDDLDLPDEIRSLPICRESKSTQPTPAISAEQLNELPKCRGKIGGIVKLDPSHPQFRGSPPGRSALPSLPNSSKTSR